MTVGVTRPPLPVKSACERAGSSSPAPPCWCSGEVLVFVCPAGVVVVSVPTVEVCVSVAGEVVVLEGAALACCLPPPQPAATKTRARAAKAGIKDRRSSTENACEEWHDAPEAMDTR